MASRNPVFGIFAALLVLALVGPACTDDAGSGNSNGVDNNRLDPTTEVPLGSKLRHVTPCNPAQPVCTAHDVTFNSSVRIKAELLDGNGNPLANKSIRFDLDPRDALGTTISATTAATDSNGTVELEVFAGATGGVAEIVASAGSEEGVAHISFQILVKSKGEAGYKIRFTHAGGAQLKTIKVRAFNVGTTCDQIRGDLDREIDPSTNPVLQAAVSAQGTASIDGTLPEIVIPGVPNGTGYVIEARAYSRNNEEVMSAWGCNADAPLVENGMSAQVTVPLVDNLPRIGGEYQITHTFSIRDGVCNPDGSGGYDGVIPDGVCLGIDLVGRLATDPASFIIGTMGNQDGLIHLVLGFLPQNVQDQLNQLLGNGFLNAAARDLLNDLFSAWLEDRAPSWLGTTVDVTRDIYESFEAFEVNGTMRVLREPVPQVDPTTNAVVGVLSENAMGEKPGRQVWEEISIFWTGQCDSSSPTFESCRKRTFSAADVGSNGVVAGDFTGTVVPLQGGGFGLVIDEHTLTLNYGAFMLGVVESVVFPQIFGPGVTSVGDALDYLLGMAVGGNNCAGTSDACECFAKAITDGGTLQNVAESACNGLLQSASDGIRGYLTDNLTADGADNFLLSVNPQTPCKLQEPVAYSGAWQGKPLPYVESLGTTQMECAWDVKIKISSSTIIDTEGQFHGVRSRSGF